MNGYEVLNIPATASLDEIRAAYRNLARRWHPDRFMPGPERDWANEKMAAINAAYRACIQALIDDGKYQTARKLLMGFDTRCAEWNYLFGAVLLKLSETQKALIYLSVAAHQAPESVKYARALKEARQLDTTRRLNNLFARRVRVGERP